MRLTDQGKLLVFLCGVLYLASLTSQSGLLLLPIGLLLGCLGVNFFMARRALRQLELEVPSEVHTAEGEPVSDPWKIHNRGASRAGFVSAESSAGVLFRHASLGPRSSATVLPTLVGARRGVYPHQEIRLASTFPFGLVKAFRKVQLTGELVVHPALYDVAAPKAAGLDPVVGGKHSGNRKTASGAEFAGVRPLQGGDPLKNIHWKASSKGQGLMVKTFQEELSGRVAFILDHGHTGDAKSLDDCLRAAGSLMFAALDEGHHVEWIDVVDPAPVLFPPFSDGQELLDRLARIEVKADCLSEPLVRAAVGNIFRRSGVCFVLTSLTPAVENVVHELVAQHRVVTVYLPAHLKLETSALGCEVRRYRETEVVGI